MSTLRIRVEKATRDQHSAIVQALRDAGVRQDQMSVQEGTGKASGPALWIAVVLFVAAAATVLAWIWVGDWRWGMSALLAVVAGFISLGLSISKGEA